MTPVSKAAPTEKLKPGATDGQKAAPHHQPGKANAGSSKKAAKSRFPRKELVKFCRGMASMLKAQINTSDAIRYYAQWASEPRDSPNPQPGEGGDRRRSARLCGLCQDQALR